MYSGLSTTIEHLHALDDCWVAWADYNVLRQRLNLAGSCGPKTTDEDIDQLLIDEFSFLSQPHFMENIVHESLRSSGGTRSCYRPPDYGRAGIFETKWGLLDAKGIGVFGSKAPVRSIYGTGLLRADEAVAEICFERFVQTTICGEKKGTVANLAMLMLPFKFYEQEQFAVSANCAILIREYFPRVVLPDNDNDIKRLFDLSLFAEMNLRRHGLTTTSKGEPFVCSDVGGFSVARSGKPCRHEVQDSFYQICTEKKVALPARFNVANLQFAVDPSRSDDLYFVDFGPFRAERKFRDHVVIAYASETEFLIQPMLKHDPRSVLKALNFESRLNEMLVKPTKSFVVDGVDLSGAFAKPLTVKLLRDLEDTQDRMALRRKLAAYINQFS